jgi:hypothetical protein
LQPISPLKNKNKKKLKKVEFSNKTIQTRFEALEYEALAEA